MNAIDNYTAQVLRELHLIDPFDELEREHLSNAVAWIKSGVEVCRTAKPATPPKHLVSYFALVDENYILLVDHRKAGLWLPSGGHVEPSENPRHTVVREIEEELGISISEEDVGLPRMVTVSSTVGLTTSHTDVSLWYAIKVSRKQSLEFDQSEFSEVRWFRFSEVPLGRCDPHLGRFLSKLEIV
jgi:8-oxo-dGTP diphosphatase